MKRVNEETIRSRHITLEDGFKLTLVISLNKKYRLVKFGWAVYNPEDGFDWIKKIGNGYATQRLYECPLTFSLSTDEVFKSDYITLRCLQTLLIAASYLTDDENDHPSSISNRVLKYIANESVWTFDSVLKRIGLEEVW